eukprot:gene1836-3551_t
MKSFLTNFILFVICSQLTNAAPSLRPSKAPSPTPTKKPTTSPTTKKPSMSPTVKPTKKPSMFPTVKPTKEPSTKPTRNPTKTPLVPTVKPTKTPTSTPTICSANQSRVISIATMNQMIIAIASHICTEGGGTFTDGNKNCANTNTASLAPIIGGTLRLSFHDSTTYSADDGSSGPDGCLNFDSSDNKGLSTIVADKKKSTTKYSLNDLYTQYSSYCSKADFWALAANVAVLLSGGPDINGRTRPAPTTSPNQNRQPVQCSCIGRKCDITIYTTADVSKPCVDFHYGRIDAQTCTTDEGRLPSSQLSHTHIRDVFTTRLGFTPREIVALMGGHTVGRATLEESQVGFTTAQTNAQNPVPAVSGAWSKQPDRFTIDYFFTITSVNWKHDTHTTLSDGITAFTPAAKTFQWNGGSATIMLNTDLALVWDLNIDPNKPTEVLCSNRNPPSLGGINNPLFGVCSQSSLGYYEHVVAFGDTVNGSGKIAWFAAWSNAWTKMQELGYNIDGTDITGLKGTLYTVTTSNCITNV